MASDYKTETRNPENPDGELIEVTIPARYYSRLYKKLPVMYENLRSAKFVLCNVKRIFSGVREYQEGGWCFTSRPLEWYIKERVIVPFPDHLIFSVYISPQLCVYEIRAEPVAPDDSFSPENWQDRYKGIVWKSTS